MTRQRRALGHAQTPDVVVPSAAFERSHVVTRHRLECVRGSMFARGPLPHIAGHVVQAVAVRRERADRRREVIVSAGKLCRATAWPVNSSPQGNTARRALRARHVPTPPRSAAVRRPSAIRLSFIPCHVDDGMRIVGVPLGLPRHRARRGRREGAKVAGGDFTVHHLERRGDRHRTRGSSAVSHRVSPGTHPIHDDVGRNVTPHESGGRSRPGSRAQASPAGPVRAATSPNIASICVGLSALNVSGAAPGTTRPLIRQPENPCTILPRDVDASSRSGKYNPRYPFADSFAFDHQCHIPAAPPRVTGWLGGVVEPLFGRQPEKRRRRLEKFPQPRQVLERSTPEAGRHVQIMLVTLRQKRVGHLVIQHLLDCPLEVLPVLASSAMRCVSSHRARLRADFGRGAPSPTRSSRYW